MGYMEGVERGRERLLQVFATLLTPITHSLTCLSDVCGCAYGWYVRMVLMKVSHMVTILVFNLVIIWACSRMTFCFHVANTQPSMDDK
jgi:uncharacterized membrane protein